MVFVPFVRYFNPIVIATIVGQAVTFADAEGLNIKFSVRRSMQNSPDTALIEIEGLDPLRAKAMGVVFRETGIGAVVTLQVGYDATPAGLFAGTLRAPFETQSQRGPALWLIAHADDGGDLFSDVLLPIFSTATLDAATMIQIGAKALGVIESPSVAAVVGASVPSSTISYTASGARRATDLLDQACRRLRCRWFLRDGQLHLAHRGLPDVTRPAVVIVPQIIVDPFADGGGGLTYGMTLLDPNILPGGQVVHLGAAFRVEAVVHSGETRSSSPMTTQIVGRAL